MAIYHSRSLLTRSEVGKRKAQGMNFMDSIYDDMKKSEKQVANYLKKLGLHWKYQFPIFVYDDKDRPRVWSPDFYIPKLGIYVEVCGSEEFNYDYRERIYQKNGHCVIFVHLYKERKKWKHYLMKKIMEIENMRHSEVMKFAPTMV